MLAWGGFSRRINTEVYRKQCHRNTFSHFRFADRDTRGHMISSIPCFPRRTIPNSASRSTRSWRCWRRTTWTSSPAWSRTSSCTSCLQYQKAWLHSVGGKGKSLADCSRWRRRSQPSKKCFWCMRACALVLPDTMVCTGCCSSLDHIVTYLFKQLSRSTKKRPTPMATDDRFLHIMQQHPEMIQQVRGHTKPSTTTTVYINTTAKFVENYLANVFLGNHPNKFHIFKRIRRW